MKKSLFKIKEFILLFDILVTFEVEILPKMATFSRYNEDRPYEVCFLTFKRYILVFMDNNWGDATVLNTDK